MTNKLFKDYLPSLGSVDVADHPYILIPIQSDLGHVDAWANKVMTLGDIFTYYRRVFIASVPPTTDDDSSEGYLAGDRWFDDATQLAYDCFDNTNGSAVWVAIEIPATTAVSDFQVGNGSGSWIKKTLAEVKTILGLGSAAYVATTTFVTHALATAANDFLVASGSGAFVKKTLEEVKTILSLGTAAYTAATAYVTHALATAENDFLVASGSGAYVKKTLVQTRAIIEPGLINGQGATLTIASGVITPTHKFHLIDTEGSAATDDVTNIAGTNAVIGDILVLSSVNTSRDPTIVTGAGTIRLPANFTMLTVLYAITLSWDGTRWRQLATAANI